MSVLADFLFYSNQLLWVCFFDSDKYEVGVYGILSTRNFFFFYLTSTLLLKYIYFFNNYIVQYQGKFLSRSILGTIYTMTPQLKSICSKAQIFFLNWNKAHKPECTSSHTNIVSIIIIFIFI